MIKTARVLTVASMVAASALVYQLPVLGQGREGRQGAQAPRAVLPEAPRQAWIGSYRNVADKMDPSKLPIIGAWRINFEKSDPSLKLQGRFKDTGTNIYTAVDGGIKTETYLYWPPTKVDFKNVFTDDAREYWFKLDGKSIYKDPQGPNGLGQTVAMWLADQNTIFRQRQTKGVDDERVLYRVSPDGKTLTWTVWSANKPAPTGESNMMVWDRVK